MIWVVFRTWLGFFAVGTALFILIFMALSSAAHAGGPVSACATPTATNQNMGELQVTRFRFRNEDEDGDEDEGCFAA